MRGKAREYAENVSRVEGLTEALIGRKIDKAVKFEYDNYYCRTPEGLLYLDDGTILELIGHEQWLFVWSYSLTHVDTVEEIITEARTDAILLRH